MFVSYEILNLIGFSFHFLSQKVTDRGMLAQRLADAVNEAEKRSEQTGESFCEGGMEVGDFLREFREQRKLFHVRNAKREMLLAQP